MAEIVNFPTKAVRDWAVIEREMRSALSQTDFSQQAQARITERMKSFYETLDPNLTFSVRAEFPRFISTEGVSALCADISEKIGATISEGLKAFTNRLFIDRLDVEIDLCRALGL